MIETLTKAVLYTSIHKLKLGIFIDCLIDEDYSGLIISGEPDEPEILSAWENIYQQYVDALGGPEHSRQVNLIKTITALQIKLEMINSSVKVLRSLYVPYFENVLIKTRMLLRKLDVSKPEAYDDLLDSALVRSRGISIDVKLNEMVLQSLQLKNQEKGMKPTREYFSNILLNLSDYCRYEITEEISVYKFCERINRYLKYAQSLKK